MSDLQIFDQDFPKGHEDHNNNNNGSEEIEINILNNTEELCRTPTSQKNKIPTVGRCPPPAPKKPRKLLFCKRKLYDHFFEVSGNEELERFFRSYTRLTPSGMAVKKRLLS
ncbi:hypothetical protein A4A49_08100 [Nicotiana attenuata]|uniref:Uncharacterized protein n=1 Tax=Nicotiana attenuata TaxID=49451 RepID=A0A314LCE3_NICAT|nr:hypothetical protein A4A49_08100 [Nicotiana attenuata]